MATEKIKPLEDKEISEAEGGGLEPDSNADNTPLYSIAEILAALPDEVSKEGVEAALRLKKQG